MTVYRLPPAACRGSLPPRRCPAQPLGEGEQHEDERCAGGRAALNLSSLLEGIVRLQYADGTQEEKNKAKRNLSFEHEHICGNWSEVQIFMWMQYIEGRTERNVDLNTI